MDMNTRSYRNHEIPFAKVPVTPDTLKIIGNNDIFINRAGTTIIVNGREVIPSISEGGYKMVSLPKRRPIAVHRLNALAWLSVPPFEPGKWVVNHIDGNIDNNHIDNLEWATYSENIEHAYKTGLRYDNRLILVKDLETGIIKEHYSLQECARYLNVNGAMVYYYLKNKNRIRKGRYVIIEKGDDWPEFTQEEIEKAKKVVEIYPIKVTNTATGEIKIYKNIHEACRELNMNFITISRRLEDKINKDHFNAKYQELVFEKLTDPEDVKKYRGDHPNKNNLQKRKPLRILVKNLSTGEEKIWESVQAFAESQGVKKYGIQKAIYLNNQWGKFKISYLDKFVNRSEIEKRKKAFYGIKDE